MKPGGERVRAFLAVGLGDELRAALVLAVAELSRAEWARPVRWVKGDSIHLTLRFLGSVSPELLAELGSRVGEVVPRHVAHRARVTGVAAFPSARRPKVIAADVEPHERLAALAADLEQAAVASGLEPESRRFRPHLTLGRLRGRPDASIRIASTAALPDLEVDAVTLYRSHLDREGARYAALSRWPLASPR